MKTKIMWLVPIVFAAAKAVAEPTLYPKNLNQLSAVRNTTDSNILADEADSKTIWVLPPNTASAKVSGLHSKTANMGFCKEMGNTVSYSRDLSAQVKELSDKRFAREEELSKMKLKADLAKEAAEAFAAEKNLGALLQLDSRIQDAETRLTELYEQFEKCQQACESIQEEISNLNKAKKEMLKQRNELAKQNVADSREYERKLRSANAAQETYKNAKAEYTSFIKDLQEVQNSFHALFDSYGRREGAQANFLYVSTWDQNVAQLRQDNPGINFSKIATKNANLMTEIADVKDIDPTSAVKSISVAGGQSRSGVVAYPNYPQNVSANVVLSLIGACPMEHPEYFDLTDNDPSNMKYGVIITYDYDSVFTAKATAVYNMYKMYQKIVSSGSSGGLFSSRSWTDVEERNFFRDSFDVTWDDKENTIPQETKNAMEAEMRRNVMLRLATLALPTAIDKPGLINAAAPPKRGAVVVADSLRQACPTNIYCQGAAIVFNILDAIFGSSRSSSSYTSITDTRIEENYKNTGKITKSWITSYL